MGPLGELERHVMDAVWDHPPAIGRQIADRMRGDADRANRDAIARAIGARANAAEIAVDLALTESWPSLLPTPP